MIIGQLLCINEDLTIAECRAAHERRQPHRLRQQEKLQLNAKRQQQQPTHLLEFTSSKSKVERHSTTSSLHTEHERRPATHPPACCSVMDQEENSQETTVTIF